MPICAWVGNRPITTVEMPIVSSAATSVVLRPTRSPKWPNTMAPNGRAKKAMENTAKDASSAAVSLPAGKNSFGNTSTAAVAYT